MDPRFLKYYNQELQHIREMSGEFAQEFPKIAGRLDLDGFECADPYVERLIEGFAFLAARVRLKVDAEFPRFTQNLLHMLYPHYLAPTPSMAIVQLSPKLENVPPEGFVVGRDTVLTSLLGKGEQTPCEFRTAHDVRLLPLSITETEFLGSTGAVAAMGVSDLGGVRAAIRLRLKTANNLPLDKIPLTTLPLFLRGADAMPVKVCEALLAQCAGLVCRPTIRPVPWAETIRKTPIRHLGFSDAEALLPPSLESFQGYRLLHEYFSLPQRFLFVELTGLGPAMKRSTGGEIDIFILLRAALPGLENALAATRFELFCTPAINLFSRRPDRVHLNDKDDEFHVIPDRTAPMDYEVFQMLSVTGISGGSEREQEFLPFYTATDLSTSRLGRAYYTINREPRRLSSRQRTQGPRSSYIGSEVFVSLVDADAAPYRSDLRQLSFEALCTNRDLPLDMPVGRGATDFTLRISAPVASVRCLSGPTKPRPSPAEGDTAWRLISHLTLNYLSLADTDDRQGAVALRELLSLYIDGNDATAVKQIEGVRSVRAKSVVRRIPAAGPITYGRGVEVTVLCEESAFEGSGVFLLGAVLDRFFMKYVTINSFTETAIQTIDRSEVMRWPTRIGQRHIF
jgi:type VI secretion system protein ImpG